MGPPQRAREGRQDPRHSQHLDRYVTQYLPTEVDDIKPDTPLFWSTFGQRRQGLVRRPMDGKNVRWLCKTYGP